MKTKCSFILKTSVALLLAILMVLGSVSTVIAAVVDVSTGDQPISTAAKKGLDIAGTAANADLASTGASQRYIYVGLSNNYHTYKDASTWGINFLNGTSPGVKQGDDINATYNDGHRDYHLYRFYVYDNHTQVEFKGNDKWWKSKTNVTLNGTKGNAVFFSSTNDGWEGCFTGDYQETSTASLSATKTSMTTSESSTLTSSLASNATYNEIMSTTYKVTTNPGSAGSVTSAGVFSATAAGTYTVTATVTYNPKKFTGITKTATATKDITVTSASTPLAAPKNVKIDNSSSDVTVDASPSADSTLSWSAVSNATSYDIYKDNTKVGTSATTSYSIARKNLNGGTYTVKAVPSSSSYSTSAASSGIKLTVNKVALTAPTVVPDKTDVVSGTKVTYTLTDNNTVGSSYYTLQSSTSSSSGFSNISGTTKDYTLSATSSGDVSCYFKATVKSDYSDYFTTSSVTTSTVYVSASGYYMLGLDGDNWTTSTDAYQVKNYEGNNVFSYTISNAAANTYFGLITAKTGGTRYQPKGSNYSTPCDVSTCSTKDTAKEIVASPSSNQGSFKISTAGTYVVYVDQTNKKVWVTQNTWAIAASAYTQTYDVATGTYKTATASTTGGTVSPASTNVEKGSSTTLKATPASGYNFDGWYKATTFTTTDRVSTNANYEFIPSANGTYYALFKQNEPAKVNISVANVSNATITAEWNNQTKTNGEILSNVPVGASVTVTVEPASGYYVTGNTPTLTNGKFTVTSTTTSISATVAKNATIKPVTNKSSRGTVIVDKTSAHKDDVIKITVTPLAGTLKSLTANYANGAIYTYTPSTSKWDKTKEPTSAGTGALEAVFLNPLKTQFNVAATGADLNDAAIAAMPDIVPVGAASTINMTMAYTSDVTINAIFDTYSAESNYYYNGYDTSGNALSGYTKKQMTEVMLEGVPYSYYQVTGRSGADQLMTVSKQTSTGNTGYAYFTRPSNWGAGWSNTKAPYAYFFNDSGQVGANYPGTMMTFVTGTDHDFKIAIPDGATKVIFSDSESGGSGAQTVDITMTSTTSAYYLNGGYQDVDGTRKYEVTAWQDQPSDAGIQTNTTEYWYNASNRYYGYVNGFNESNNSWSNHNAGSHTTDGNRFAEPGENTGNKTYYVMVFYAGKKYTSGSGTLDLTGNENHDVVMWSYELPSGSDDENVTVYAKDGAIRGETFGSTYANIADTKIYAANGTSTVGTKHSGSITNQTYETYKAAKGDTIVIKTQIGATDSGNLSNADALKAKYYVRGFCVNGEVSELLEWKSDGLYTLTYKIPEDTEITKFEITPIYYLKDTTAYPIVTYRVTGFTDELKAVGTGKPGWGDTLYTYPYYGKLGGDSNAFGAYPGQPMVYYKGQYQMQIPQKSTTWVNTTSSNTTVSGVTMSNGYWDSVHKSIMGYGDNSTSADHVQTYDYGDFYKIFNEKKPVDNIVFDFKYRTKKHNLVNDNTSTSIDASTLTSAYGTNGNGFEMLTNFHGKNVDLFGNPLSGTAADPEQTTPIYVVSIGGVNENGNPQYGVENIAGYYATEWRVYAPNTPTSLSSTYKKVTVGNKSSIPPEVLVLNNDDNTSFNTSTYPSADASHYVTDWKAMYTELKKYAGHPVMISYEAADAQQGQGMYYTGTGGATRNDGRWLYSKTGENITSTIKIQYSDDNGDTYTDLNTTTPQVSGLSAYFTNDGVEGQMTYSTTIDPDKTFDFEAKTTNGNYKFVGWYMKDGTKITSDNASHTERSGSYTFVAKFMKVESGQLILSHSVDTNTTYKGAGTAKISAVVKNGEEVIRTYDLTTSDITLDDKIIKSDSSYTIDVTLEATATGNDTYGTTTLANPSGQTSTYFSQKSSSTSGKTTTIVLNSFTVQSLFTSGTTTQNVKNIIYHSYFHQTKFDYQLTFNYKDRFNESKSFTRKGQLTSAQVANKNYVQQSDGSFTLLPAFIQTVAPYESNFGEDITWNIDKTSFTQSGSTYTCTATITAKQTEDTTRNVTFKLPYQHSNGIATGGNTGTAAETTNFDLKGDNAVTFDTIPTLLNNGVNGIYDEDIKKNWIAAPATINDNSTTKYFQYWSVKSTSADGANDPEVARCYFQGFNFCALDNYTVTAVYGNEATDISNSGIYTGVSYLETSRNQWNDNQDRTKSEGTYASDLLFNDFILNYNFKGVDIYRGGSDTNDIQELGVVVERVQELGIKQDGSKDTDISHYTSIAENRDTVNSVINGTSSDKKFTKDAIAKTDLDNKNRIKFYEAFYNGKGWSMENQSSAIKYTYKNWVYRAYTYIKYTDDQNHTQIVLSAKPAYFTMYDEAVADYVAPTTNTSGN